MSETDQDQLTDCTACGKPISMFAATCPHCGDPKTNDSGLLGCTLAILSTGLLLLILWVLGNAIFLGSFGQ